MKFDNQLKWVLYSSMTVNWISLVNDAIFDIFHNCLTFYWPNESINQQNNQQMNWLVLHFKLIANFFW